MIQAANIILCLVEIFLYLLVEVSALGIRIVAQQMLQVGTTK